MDNPAVIALCALVVVMIGHLVTFVWWAATITRRVGELEKDMGTTGNGPTVATRMALVEQSLASVQMSLQRIEGALIKPKGG
jgi:hypothetical protein